MIVQIKIVLTVVIPQQHAFLALLATEFQAAHAKPVQQIASTAQTTLLFVFHVKMVIYL